MLFAEKVRRHESGPCQRPLYSRTYPARERNDAFYQRDSPRLVPFSFSLSDITRLRFRGRCLLEYFAVNEHYEIFIIQAKDDARKLLINKWLKMDIPGLRVAVRTIAFVEIQKMLPPYISARLYKTKDFSDYDRRSRPEN